MKKHYLTNCVSSDANSISNMIDGSREIGYRSFIQQVSLEHLLAVLPGYHINRSQGLTLRDDWHVRYYRSIYRGKPCVYLCHSAIEYVFV
ncbi:MAG: hypothetical protein PHE87_10100 [Victivallaceae bacterium]|nr:hypothetical protein [Victivallaceae bacterium]